MTDTDDAMEALQNFEELGERELINDSKLNITNNYRKTIIVGDN